MSDPQELQNEDEKTSKLELFDFWAVWCGPCKIMDPILHEIEEEYKDKIAIKKYNVDEEQNQQLVQQYNVMSIPTYLLMKDGQVVATFIGTQPKATITNKIDELL